MAFPNIVGMAFNKPSHVRDEEGNIYSKIELFHEVRKHIGPITPIEMDYEKCAPSKEAARLNAVSRFLSSLETSAYDDAMFTNYIEINGHFDRIEFCILNNLGRPKNYNEADDLCGESIVNTLIDFSTPFFDADPEGKTAVDVYAFPVWYSLTLSYGL